MTWCGEFKRPKVEVNHLPIPSHFPTFSFVHSFYIIILCLFALFVALTLCTVLVKYFLFRKMGQFISFVRCSPNLNKDLKIMPLCNKYLYLAVGVFLFEVSPASFETNKIQMINLTFSEDEKRLTFFYLIKIYKIVWQIRKIDIERILIF